MIGHAVMPGVLDGIFSNLEVFEDHPEIFQTDWKEALLRILMSFMGFTLHSPVVLETWTFETLGMKRAMFG
jgi:hypothetical protein